MHEIFLSLLKAGMILETNLNSKLQRPFSDPGYYSVPAMH